MKKNESSSPANETARAPRPPSLDGLIRRLVAATPEELATVEQALNGDDNLRLLTVAEAAQRMDVSAWYVYDLMRRGLLEYVRQRGKFCKIPERVVDAYLTNLTRGGDIGKSGRGKNWRADFNNASGRS